MQRQQRLTRLIALRLVTINDDGDVTRQRALLSDLVTLDEDHQTVINLVNTFSDHRLFTLDRDPITRTPVVQLAHEALIQSWGRLHNWIDENRDNLRLQKRLNTLATEWNHANQDTSYLISGSRLAQFEGLTTDTLELNPLQRKFLDASMQARRRAVLRVRLFIASLICIAMIAIGAAIIAADRQSQAEQERDRADIQSRIARSRELAILSLTNNDTVDRALLLSLEAIHSYNTYEARDSLLTALQSAPYLQTLLHGHRDSIRALDVSHDGQWIASGSRDQTVILWDATTNSPSQTLSGHSDWVNSVAFNQDGSLLASGDATGTLLIWDVAQAERVITLNMEEAVWAVAFSPAQDHLAVGLNSGTIHIVDATTGDIVETLTRHDSSTYDLTYSHDGRYLASASADNTVRLWDTSTWETIHDPLVGHENWVFTVAFNADASLLASGGADNTVIVWDVQSGEVITMLDNAHTDWVRALAFAPDGSALTSTSWDGTIRSWDTRTWQDAVPPLIQAHEAIWDVAYLSDGRTLISAGERQSIAVWDLQTPSPLIQTRYATTLPSLQLAINNTGTQLASANGDPTGQSFQSSISVWDLRSGEQRYELVGHSGPVLDVAFHPQSAILASTGADRQIILWDLETGEPLRAPLLAHNDVIRSIAFSPDGRWLVSASEDGSIFFWETDTYSIVDTIMSESGFTRIAFNPAGDLLASANRAFDIQLWDVATREPVGDPLLQHSAFITDLAFHPDGNVLASSSRDETIVLWDVNTQQLQSASLTAHTHYVHSIDFTADGLYMVSGSRDETVLLWDMGTLQPIGQPLTLHTDWVNDTILNPATQTLITGGNDGRILLWDMALATWMESACAIANRDFSETEQATLLNTVQPSSSCNIP